MKRPIIFSHIFKLPLHFYMLTKFRDQQIIFQKMPHVSIRKQNRV